MGPGERGVREYKVIEAHYGTENTFWRVVVAHENSQLETVGKFPTEVSKKGKKFSVHYENKKLIEYDMVLEAVGRQPNLEKIGLDDVFDID